jgi:hypothetical protein
MGRKQTRAVEGEREGEEGRLRGPRIEKSQGRRAELNKARSEETFTDLASPPQSGTLQGDGRICAKARLAAWV